MRTLSMKANGSHSVSVFTTKGESVVLKSSERAQKYDLSTLRPGAYIFKITTPRGTFTERVMFNW